MTRAVRIVVRDFVHAADCPLSVDVLQALREGWDWRPIGLHVEANGLDVCWESLLDSYLSSSEKATVRLVQAVARIEGWGRLPRRVQAAVSALLDDLCGQRPHRPLRTGSSVVSAFQLIDGTGRPVLRPVEQLAVLVGRLRDVSRSVEMFAVQKEIERIAVELIGI